MRETVRLYSKDYTELLLTTHDREEAKRFFLASGRDWLPIVIDYGTNWRQRWSGRIECEKDAVAIHQDREYLQSIMCWPTDPIMEEISLKEEP